MSNSNFFEVGDKFIIQKNNLEFADVVVGDIGVVTHVYSKGSADYICERTKRRWSLSYQGYDNVIPIFTRTPKVPAGVQQVLADATKELTEFFRIAEKYNLTVTNQHGVEINGNI